MRAGMDLCAVQGSQIKVAGAATTPDETHLSLIAHAVKQAETVDFPGRSVALPLAALADRRFMQLAVIAPDPLQHV